MVWIKPAGCVALRSVAICIIAWTEARVKGCRGIAPLLLGGESDSMSLPEEEEESEHGEDDDEWC